MFGKQINLQDMFYLYVLLNALGAFNVIFCLTFVSFETDFLEMLYREQLLPEIQPRSVIYQDHQEPQATIVENLLLGTPLNHDFSSQPAPNSTNPT